jgi:hypothetical protein
MRALHRRLLRLEDRFGSPVETEYSGELRRRIEAGRRRVAAMQGETTFRGASPRADASGGDITRT